MSPRTFLFSCEPGGTEVLSPVARLMESKGWEVTVASYGLGLARFQANGIKAEEIAPIAAGDRSLLNRWKPSLVITSATSLPQKDLSEKYLWKNAQAQKIKSLAFLDQWQNYAVRFSGPQPAERLAYLPDAINCLNDTGRQEMLAEGFPANRLIPFGHPYLSELKETAKKLDPGAVRRKLGIPADSPTLLFVSEPIEDSFGNERGYTEYSALDFFISNVWPAGEKRFLILKLHDKDAPTKYASYVGRLGPNVRVLGREATPIETLLAADRVYGMTSMMLIQSFILGKETVSLQPGLTGPDPLVLTRDRYIRLVRTKNEFAAPWNTKDPASFEFTFQKEKFMTFAASLI